jgi:hypothetical protein
MLAAARSLENIMQTSRFQLGLIAALALGLGFSLSSSDAVGYPAGAAVSLGTNPVFSAGGSVVSGSGATVITAPISQDLILSDVLLASSTNAQCKRSHHSILSIDGTIAGVFETSSSFGAEGYHEVASDGGAMISHSFSAGIRVPAGQTLEIEVSETWSFSKYGSCSSELSGGVRYTVSGYYAQP